MTKNDAILVDTNVLLLLLVGAVGVNYLARHKRTARYDGQAYVIARQYISRFPTVLTTPHVLAETANLLSGGLNGSALQQVWEAFRTLCGRFDERHVPIHTLVREETLRRLGVTDTGIIRLSGRGWVVLTDDLPLFVALQERNLSAVNFTHLRLAAAGNR